MSDPPVSPGTVSTAEANRRFYAVTAETYDRTEECVVEPRLQGRLRETLVRALALVPPNARVVDACGGSGNASLLLHELGARPLTVDISPEMLELYARKARAHGWEPWTRVAEIEAFLAEGDTEWDLVVFSSALHHLDDYARTVDLAAARLAPGGVLVTIFDPLQVGPLGERLRWLDYVLHVVIKTPGRVPRLIARRLRRSSRTEDGEAFGAQAERHSLVGIDDLALRRRFEAAGLTVVEHGRTYDLRFRVTRGVARALGSPSSFHFIVRRPPAA